MSAVTLSIVRSVLICLRKQLMPTCVLSGEERSPLYKSWLGLRRQRPVSGRGSVQVLTCARVTALCLSLLTGLLLVLATRHPPVQQVLKGGVQKAGELLQGVRTPALEVSLACSHACAQHCLKRWVLCIV